jgi:HEAT repeat protein
LDGIKDESALDLLKALVLQAATANGDAALARVALQSLSQHQSAAVRGTLFQIARSKAALELRVEETNGLGEIENDPTVADDLRKILAAEQHKELQEAVVEALSESKLPRAPTALADLVRTAANPEVRKHAIEALSRQAGEKGFESLIQLYDAEKDERLKETIVKALGEPEEKLALRKLIEIARCAASIKLRKRAIKLLGESDDPTAIKFLEQLIQ